MKDEEISLLEEMVAIEYSRVEERDVEIIELKNHLERANKSLCILCDYIEISGKKEITSVLNHIKNEVFQESGSYYLKPQSVMKLTETFPHLLHKL